jgi:response regulator RpfG family c-di-GMP phosphodiesterase
MLTRILVAGGSDDLLQGVAEAAQDAAAQVLALAEGATLPPASAAVLSGLDCLAEAVRAAVVVGKRNEELLRLLSTALDCREGLVAGSSVRVLEHATRFAQALALGADDQLTLERGALIRDIGKMPVPNEVLLKPGKLTYEEWVLLQQHPSLGAQMVRESLGLKDTAEIVRSHHENFEGDGYPDGLEGEAIPFSARVMRILDAYCAMTSPRLYRDGHSSHEEAIEHLRSEKGKHYDPRLVDVFISENVGRTA